MSSVSNNPKVTKKQKEDHERREMVKEYLEYVRQLEIIIEHISVGFTKLDADGELASISIQRLESGDYRGSSRRYFTDSDGNTSRKVAFTTGESFASVLGAINQCLQHDLFTWRDDRFWKPKRSLPAHLGTD